MTLIKKLHCAFRKRQHRLCCGACRQGKEEGATNHTCPRNLRLQDLDHVHCNPALRFVSPILCRSFHDSFNLRLSFRRVNDKGEAHQHQPKSAPSGTNQQGCNESKEARTFLCIVLATWELKMCAAVCKMVSAWFFHALI